MSAGDDEDAAALCPRLWRAPTARAAASGSSTSCTQRGTTTRGWLARRRRSESASALAPRAPAGDRRRRLGGAFSETSLTCRPTIARVWLSRGVPGSGRRRAAGGSARILFVGDVVGGIGRRTLLDCLPVLRERHEPTFVVVNGENAAGGLGITPKIADQLFAAGVDAITLGNHTYHRREIYPYLDARAADPAAGQLPAQPARPRACAWSSATACASAWSTSAATSTCAPGARRSPRSRSRSASSPRSTTCSSTCTPRRPPRRSRWAGTSTGA